MQIGIFILYLFTHNSAIFVLHLMHGISVGFMAKITGSTLEYAEERINALMREYDQYIASCEYIRMSEVFDHIVNQPCRRFWVSNIRAAVVIARMMKGDKLKNLRPTKREMFQEIYERVCKLKRLNPTLSLFQLVSEVVTQPAPKFYLTPSSAKIMVYKAKKEWFAKKKRKLRLS